LPDLLRHPAKDVLEAQVPRVVEVRDFAGEPLELLPIERLGKPAPRFLQEDAETTFLKGSGRAELGELCRGICLRGAELLLESRLQLRLLIAQGGDFGPSAGELGKQVGGTIVQRAERVEGGEVEGALIARDELRDAQERF